jgi:thiamine biosynthesis protein ThiS
MSSMDLILNGEAYRHTGQATIAELLRECQAEAGRTAVMVNGEVMRKSNFDTVKLGDGDHVELIMIAAGG